MCAQLVLGAALASFRARWPRSVSGETYEDLRERRRTVWSPLAIQNRLVTIPYAKCASRQKSSRKPPVVLQCKGGHKQFLENKLAQRSERVGSTNFIGDMTAWGVRLAAAGARGRRRHLERSTKKVVRLSTANSCQKLIMASFALGCLASMDLGRVIFSGFCCGPF